MARSLIALIAITSLAGCAAAGSEGEVKLGVDVAPIISTTTGSQVDGADSPLAITRVRVLVDDAKIGYTGSGPGGAEAKVGPYVIDLAADEIKSGAHREFSLGTLPSGTYGGAEIEIQPLQSGDDSSDSSFDDFRTSASSLIVEGTYNGSAFTFAGHFLAEQGTDGDVTVDAANPVTLAMTVDPSGWFLDTSGAALDPSDSAQHDTLAAAVCKTLDTQPQLAGSQGGRGGPGGGGAAHCVEQAGN